jgi:hypothetical protein
MNQGAESFSGSILVEAWHTIERAFGGVQNTDLPVKPYVIVSDSDVLENSNANIVFRPGDPAGSHDNVFVTWTEVYAALQAVHGLGIVYLEFDDTFVSQCSVPPGVWNMDAVIWTCAFHSSPLVVFLEDGASITVNPPFNFMVYGRGMEIQSDRVGPIAPFVGVNILLDGGAARLTNNNPGSLPMIETNGFSFIAITGAGFRSSIGELGSDLIAPLIDVQGGTFVLLGGAGTMGNNALTDTVGGGFALINPADDSFQGNLTNEFSNPAFIAAGGVIAISPTQAARDFFVGSEVTTAGGPYQASYNELVLVDTTDVVTVNAPSANPAQGETFTVKDATGNALAKNITILPMAGDTMDGLANATIATNGGSKTWMTDGTGTWRLVSSV